MSFHVGGGMRDARAGLVAAVVVGLTLYTALTGKDAYWWHEILRGGDAFAATAVAFIALAVAAPVWLAVVALLRARNGRIVLNREGLTLRNWRGAARGYAWDEVVGLRWAGMFESGSTASFSLASGGWVAMVTIEVRRPHERRVRRVRLGYCGARSIPAWVSMRDAIIERAGLSEVREPPSLLERLATVDTGEAGLWRRMTSGGDEGLRVP
jgi:hypothetical protein